MDIEHLNQAIVLLNVARDLLRKLDADEDCIAIDACDDIGDLLVDLERLVRWQADQDYRELRQEKFKANAR